MNCQDQAPCQVTSSTEEVNYMVLLAYYMWAVTIVHIDMEVSTELGVCTSLDCALISGTSILQTKRHGDITISPDRGYEYSFYLIFHSKFNLVIASCGIQK